MKSGISPRHWTMDVAEFDGLPLAVTLIHRAPGAQPVALDGRSAIRTAADLTDGAGIKSSAGSASSEAAVVADPGAGVPETGGCDDGVPQLHTVASIESNKAARRACTGIPTS
jgi:predicted flavoprotein YhiN